MRPAQIAVGAPAPELFGGSGAPRVIAFVSRWSPAAEAPARLHATRRFLRGLAAELIVFSDDGAWLLGADDAVDQLSLPGEAASAAWLYGVNDGGDAVFVIDGDGIVRFAHRLEAPLAADLVEALAAAIEALRSRPEPLTFNRREWVTTCLVAGCAFAFLRGCDAPAPPAVARTAPGELAIVLDINGRQHSLAIEPRVSLLDVLRERLGLTGTKKGCDAGQCGACTVHVDGRRELACLTLAAMCEGKKVTTIEGLARGDELHPMQAAFIEHDGLQCGFCTPGQIMSAVALVAERRADSDQEIREQMSGNICRCGAYPNIIAAIQAARRGS